MTIETVTEQPKKQVSKKLIAIVIAAAVVLIGGAVSAFFFFNLSPKEQYFLAEKKSAEFIAEQFEKRFQSEKEWAEHARNNPIEQSIQLSAEYQDPNGLFFDETIQQMINHSSIAINSAVDLKNKVVSADLQANLSDLKLSGLEVYLTSEQIMLGLPFLDELLQIDETSLNKLLNKMDPYAFPDDETFKFDAFFEQMSGSAFEEDWEYLKSEYLAFIYEELPEEAFSTETDSIAIGNEDIKAEKLTMNLSEEEIKALLQSLFDKMQKDEKLKEILEHHFSAQLGSPAKEVSEMLEAFDEGLQLAKERLDSHLQIPNGMTSIIWTHKDLIVQREFSIEFGPSEDELMKLEIAGTQQLNDREQTFDYEINIENFSMENALKVKGDFAVKDDETTDSFTISMDDVELSYKGTETKDGNAKEFEREIGIDVNAGYEQFAGSLIWSGNAAYEKDKMNAEHQLSLDVEGLQPDMLSLIIHTDAKTVDEVTLPEDQPTKDIGAMSEAELMDYIETDIAPQFQEWLFTTFGGFMSEL